MSEDQGVISANLYHHRHKDFLQRVDVSPSPDNLQSATGNIGSGDMLVADVRASLRMNVINLPNLLINARASIRDSEVKDPLPDRSALSHSSIGANSNWDFVMTSRNDASTGECRFATEWTVTIISTTLTICCLKIDSHG